LEEWKESRHFDIIVVILGPEWTRAGLSLQIQKKRKEREERTFSRRDSECWPILYTQSSGKRAPSASLRGPAADTIQNMESFTHIFLSNPQFPNSCDRGNNEFRVQESEEQGFLNTFHDSFLERDWDAGCLSRG
jgi:hypothetical protein